MTTPLEITFARLDAAPEATCAAFAGQDLALSPAVQALNNKSQGLILKAAEAAAFKGKQKTSIEILAPQKLDVQRLVLIGAGKAGEHGDSDWANLGGYALAQITARKTSEASLVAEVAGAGSTKPEIIAANLAFGALLRHYTFRKYQTKKNGGEEGAAGNGAEAKPASDGLVKLVVHCADPDKAEAAFEAKRAIAEGVCYARDLVNEPANVLGPVEFADRVKELESIGLEVEILDADALKELKMNTLLSVAQGSVRPARVAIMQWHGDTFDLPEGAVLLASSAKYPHQAFRWGRNAFGFQFHPELTPFLFKCWMVDAAYDAHEGVIDLRGCRAEAEEALPRMQNQTRAFLAEWLDRDGAAG